MDGMGADTISEGCTPRISPVLRSTDTETSLQTSGAFSLVQSSKAPPKQFLYLGSEALVHILYHPLVHILYLG